MAEDDWQQRMLREEEERAQRVNGNKFLLMNELRELGVRELEIDYNGSGDEGEINEIVGYDRNGCSVTLDGRLRDDLRNYAYDVLASRHPGWEIDNGSFGSIKFDMMGDKVTLQHNARVEQTEEYREEW